MKTISRNPIFRAAVMVFLLWGVLHGQNAASTLFTNATGVRVVDKLAAPESKGAESAAVAAAPSDVQVGGRPLNALRLMGVERWRVDNAPNAAAGYFEAVLEEEPEEVLSAFFLGRLRAEQGDIQEALSLWRGARAAPYFLNQAIAFQRQDQPEKAIRYLKLALDIDPHYMEAKAELAWLYLLMDQANDAHPLWRSLYGELPDNSPWKWFAHGQVLWQEGSWYEAGDAFVNAANRNVGPQRFYPSGFYYAGQAYYKAGRTSEAITALQKAIERHPGRTSAHWLLSEIYNEKNDYQNAEKWLRKAYEQHPDRRKTVRLLALTNYYAEDYSEAIEFFYEYDASVQEVETSYYIGNSYLKLEQAGEAIKVLEMNSHKADFADYYLALHDAYNAVGNADMADQALQMAHDLQTE